MTIENLPVYEGEELTLARLPDPATLDDEALDLWQLGTLMLEVNPAIDEDDAAAARFGAWEAAIEAEWRRRGLDVLAAMASDFATDQDAPQTDEIGGVFAPERYREFQFFVGPSRHH